MPPHSPWADLWRYLVRQRVRVDEPAWHDLMRVIVHAAMEADVRHRVEADRYERKSARRAYRNGYRLSWWRTPFGDVELRIPKLRKGTYYPDFLGHLSCAEQIACVALAARLGAVNFEMVERLIAQLGLALNRWEIADIYAQIADTAEAVRQSSSAHHLTQLFIEMPSFSLDDGQALLAIGETADGDYLFLDGAWVKYVDEAFWEDFLRRLAQRGIEIYNARPSLLYPRAIRLQDVAVDSRVRVPLGVAPRRASSPLAILSIQPHFGRAA